MGLDMPEREEGIIGMHTFAVSAPLKDVQKKFGFTPDCGANSLGGRRN